MLNFIRNNIITILFILLVLIALMSGLSIWYESLDDKPKKHDDTVTDASEITEVREPERKQEPQKKVYPVESWVYYDGPMVQTEDEAASPSEYSDHYEAETMRITIEAAEPATEAAQTDETAEPEPAILRSVRSASAACVEFTDEDVRMLAVLLENESINLADEREWPLPMWCVLNRMDDTTGQFPATIYAILTQPRQFLRSYNRTPRQSTIEFVKDQLRCYLAWRSGESEDRPLPVGLVFYYGCGSYNLFRTSYYGGHHWAKGEWLD